MTSFLVLLGTLPAADPHQHAAVTLLPPVGVVSPCAPDAANSRTPRWDALMNKACWCPGPAVQPFQMLPRVCPLEPCPCGPALVCGPAPNLWVKEFHHAAHVPLPRFTIDGKEIAN